MRARILGEANRKWLTLAAVSFGLFMIMLDNTVVNVALPSIQRSAVLNGFRQVGGSIGIALIGAIMASEIWNRRTPEAFIDGSSTALVGAAALVRPHPERKGVPVPEVA
ncbi:MAG: hypothetical protein H0V20_03430 [Actinobacteria bacterium]|nr:hypothetical protein [Actinomycetota bacterium]